MGSVPNSRQGVAIRRLDVSPEGIGALLRELVAAAPLLAQDADDGLGVVVVPDRVRCTLLAEVSGRRYVADEPSRRARQCVDFDPGFLFAYQLFCARFPSI